MDGGGQCPSYDNFCAAPAYQLFAITILTKLPSSPAPHQQDDQAALLMRSCRVQHRNTLRGSWGEISLLVVLLECFVTSIQFFLNWSK